jgi:multidrug resistance efflux pump
MTAVAVVLGWAMWNAYMGAPWTRDGTVRTYVVTMAPEVAGRIVELPVRDNQLVRKGDVLLVIDPTDYQIAVRLAEAAVHQAQANAQNIDAQISVQQAQIAASQAQVEQAQAAVTFSQQQAARYKDLAEREYGTDDRAGLREPRPGQGQSGAYANPRSGGWLGDQSPGPAG